MNCTKSSLLICLLFPFFALAQVLQPCVVKQYNQKETKTPLAGVQVEVRGAGTEVSDAQGMFTLNFTTLKPGDRVTMRSITKSGYEIFNTSAVAQWIISRDRTPFQIVLVKSEYMAQLKRSLRETSTENYKLKYEQAKRELKAEKEAGKMKEEEFYKQMEALEDLYDKALKDIDNYIDQFAHFDLNEVSAEEQRILEMVQQGQINEAVKAYEALDISNKLIQQKEKSKQLALDAAVIAEEQSKTKQSIDYLKEAFNREITTLKLAGGRDNFDKIGRMLKEQVLADTTDLNAVHAYAQFVYQQADYKEAEKYYLIYLSLCADNREKYAITLNNLGNLYLSTRDYAKAKESLLASLEIRKTLFQQDSIRYCVDLSNCENSLGNLSQYMKNYEEAERYYLDALKHTAIDCEVHPDICGEDISMMQTNLGTVYRYMHDYAKSEQYYLAALEERTKLFQRDPEKYRENLATTQNNLGVLYSKQQDYTRAEQYYEAALVNTMVLFEYNPDSYRRELSQRQSNIGTLYYYLEQYAKAETYLLAALENKTILFQQNPEVYRSTLSSTQNNLGLLYKAVEDYNKAELYFLSAIENRIVLFQQFPDAYRAEIAATQSNLALMYYRNLQDYEKAEKYFQEALGHTIVLYQSNQKKFKHRLVTFYKTMADFYAEQGRFEQALTSIDSAIVIENDNAGLYDTKGEILLMSGDEQGALEMWRKVMELDPDFLKNIEKIGGESKLYKRLKEKGMVE